MSAARRRLPRRAALIPTAFVAAALPALAARSEVPLCRVEARIEPPRAFVGEQVTWTLRVRRRADVDEMHWVRPPTFPAFRAEWLPGLVGPETHREQGVSVRVYEERRALFPAREGRLVVPEAELVCEREATRQAVAIPSVSLEAVAPPETGRPADWQGLVGPVQLTRSIGPRRLRLGEAVRVAIVAQGPSNLWDAPSPLEGAFEPDEADLFPVRRRMARDAAARLRLRRYFTYDVVPRRVGRLRIPPARLTTWDPQQATWRVVEAPGAEILVEPELEPDAPRRRAGAEPDADEAAPPAPRATGWTPWLVAAGAALLAGAGALVLMRRRGVRETSRGEDETACLARAREAEEAGELDAAADALARALRAALARAVPGAETRATEELFVPARGEMRELMLRLQRLDRMRFAPGGPSAAELRTLRAEIAAWCDAGGPERLRRDC